MTRSIDLHAFDLVAKHLNDNPSRDLIEKVKAGLSKRDAAALDKALKAAGR